MKANKKWRSTTKQKSFKQYFIYKQRKLKRMLFIIHYQILRQDQKIN
jgi:hypothetical protein